MSPGDVGVEVGGNWFGHIFLKSAASEAAPLRLGRTSHCLRARTAAPHRLSPSPCQGMKKGVRTEVKKMGPLKVAHLNGLSVSRPPLHSDLKDEPERASNDERVRLRLLTLRARKVLI